MDELRFFSVVKISFYIFIMNMYEYEEGVNMLSVFDIIARRDGNEVFEPQFEAISNPRSSVFVHLF